MWRVQRRLAYLLTCTAGSLKGRPEPFTLHDWSDLPRVAAELRKERDALREENRVLKEQLTAEGGHSWLEGGGDFESGE